MESETRTMRKLLMTTANDPSLAIISLCLCRNGHEAVVRLLVEREDVDADSKAFHGQSPLLWALRIICKFLHSTAEMWKFANVGGERHLSTPTHMLGL